MPASTENLMKKDNAELIRPLKGDNTEKIAESKAVEIIFNVNGGEYLAFGTAAVAPQPIDVSVADEPFYRVKTKRGFRYALYRANKRFLDIFLGTIALIALSPFILIALFVKFLEDGKNPVYVQKRVGKDGKLFNFYKIRTMCVGAEGMKDDLISKGLNEADGAVFKIKEDPRITKIGKIYRKLSIDEILQLINIINGTMSIVGPRPPLPREVETYGEYEKQRLSVKGGLLCLWQVEKNRHQIKFEDWVKLDLEYIEKQSLWLDIKIVVKGAVMVLFDRTGE